MCLEVMAKHSAQAFLGTRRNHKSQLANANLWKPRSGRAAISRLVSDGLTLPFETFEWRAIEGELFSSLLLMFSTSYEVLRLEDSFLDGNPTARAVR